MAKIRVYVNELEDPIKIVSLEDIAVIQEGDSDLGYLIKYKQGLNIILSKKEIEKVFVALAEG